MKTASARYAGRLSSAIASNVCRAADLTSAERVSEVSGVFADVGYYKVGEIHPAHAFLSLPDKALPDEEPPGPLQNTNAGSRGIDGAAPREFS